jgi:hypothetical protein
MSAVALQSSLNASARNFREGSIAGNTDAERLPIHLALLFELRGARKARVISQYKERGFRQPTLSMLLRLADSLDTEPTKMVEDTLANLQVESLG